MVVFVIVWIGFVCGVGFVGYVVVQYCCLFGVVLGDYCFYYCYYLFGDVFVDDLLVFVVLVFDESWCDQVFVVGQC